MMGLITFICRFFFIGVHSKKDVSDKWSRRLSFVPPAFLTTMIVPSIVYTDSTTVIHIFDNPYFYATALTLFMTKFTKNFTVITVGGTVIFFVVRIIFSFVE